MLEKYNWIAESKAEYKIAYSFHFELPVICKWGELTNEEIIKRENKLRKTLLFFPCKNYLKQVKLNGCKYWTNSVKSQNKKLYLNII